MGAGAAETRDGRGRGAGGRDLDDGGGRAAAGAGAAPHVAAVGASPESEYANGVETGAAGAGGRRLGAGAGVVFRQGGVLALPCGEWAWRGPGAGSDEPGAPRL